MKKNTLYFLLSFVALISSIRSLAQGNQEGIGLDARQKLAHALIMEEAIKRGISLPLSRVKKQREEIVREAEEYVDRMLSSRYVTFDENSHRESIALTVPLLEKNQHFRFQRTDGVFESGIFYFFDGDNVNLSGGSIARRFIPAQVLARFSEETREHYINTVLDKLRAANARENEELRSTFLVPELNKRFNENGFYKIDDIWMDHLEVRNHFMSILSNEEGEFKRAEREAEQARLEAERAEREAGRRADKARRAEIEAQLSAEKVAEVERLLTERKKDAEARSHLIEDHFSFWDGSHKHLVRFVKSRLNDDRSFRHDKTTYLMVDDGYIVHMTYRAKNAFGGMVRESIRVKYSMDGNPIDVISVSP
jgi:hypothetical protein